MAILLTLEKVKAMTNTKFSSLTKPETIQPFKVSQAVAAIGLAESDDKVLGYIDFLARQIPIQKAEFLHVLPTFDLFTTLFEKEGKGLVSNYELNEEAIREMKKATQERLAKQNIGKVSFDVREGDPLEELLKEVEETDADLTIIGQRGATSQHGILARNLARKTTGNALIIPEEAKKTITRILVPVDFSPSSVKALQIAVGINRQLKEPAEIVCLNVFEMPSVASVYIRKTTEELKQMIKNDRMESFRQFLRTYAPEDAGRIKTELIENKVGDIGTYIMDYATKIGSDMIIIGAKGHSRVERLLLGSVTERMLSENETIPTLVVKLDE